MDSLERCRILCGISEDNTKKLGLLSVLLEKSREDIEAFCRDTFIEPLTNNEGIITGYTDVFPNTNFNNIYLILSGSEETSLWIGYDGFQ